MSPAWKWQAVAGVWLMAVFTALPPQARADDWSDCNGPVLQKVEAACTAIIADAARPPADKVKALLNRSRIHLINAKIDPALADAEAALQLDGNSASVLLTRG